MNGLKLFLTCVVINIYFRRVTASHGTGQCGSTKLFGDNGIHDFDDITSNSNYAYMMNDEDLIIDCCGVIHRWDVTVEGVPAGTTPIYFQVWRPTAAGGNSYELVGQNVETVTSDGSKTFNIATANRITVKNKDRFGWYVNGDDIVTYKAGGREFDANHMQAMASAPTVGNTVSWGGTIANDRSYAIRVVVDPNTDPVFTNTQWSISVGNAVAIGTSLVKLTVNDDDSNDVSTLVVTMVANTKYSFDTSTYILTTAGSLGADGGTSTELSFRVADQCGNTGSATFTVTITNDPPVIHSLPNVISVSEDETLETLLHTLNVTDTYGAPTCSLAASVPAEWPFFMQKVPGTSDYGIYSESSPGFNYVVKKSYDIPVECTDGFLSDTETLSVKLIQNTPPVILNLQNSTSVSTTDPIGTTAFYVIATDSTNDDITFSMTCSPVVCPFKIFNSGEIQITEDLSGHTVVGYDLQITVADSRNTVGPRLLTITIADLNDPVQLTNIPSSVVIKENSAVGALVYTVSFSDIDTSQKHTFAMTSSPVQGLSYFSIDPSTGQVTTSGVINYEALTATSFILGVTVTDPVTSDAANLTVTVSNINEAPSFAQSSYSLSASEGLVGTVIGTPPFGLADPDAGDSVTLTLDCGSQTAYFYMHSTSGQISYQSSYDLDSGSLPSAVTCNLS
ncbi:hypothetical protein DPMN_185408 [Dreissena polymorpha]|uniref:Cadherin domain-containing protein n=1 Tax=Dreissena polymorpha TaxID=45954 RepID=A0A9D4DJM3_DREPO|nr:hypothetical protein DPMN_185408 [Dreissena polymorpha]